VNISELKLLDSISCGDKKAMASLYKEYTPRLERFLLRVTRDPEIIQELVNDVMLTVWQQAGTFRRESAVSTWILGITYRKALDAVRKGKRYHSLLSQWVNIAPKSEWLDGTGEERDLMSLLEKLSPEQRAVAELAFGFGYSYPEIEEILDIPINTVKTRIFYARKIMQTAYTKSWG